jgi:non-ribosomal peptide synthetase component F
MTTAQRRPVAHRIERTADGYDYQLLVKQLLHSTPADAADQEIVYRDLQRFDYQTLRQRIGRLATGLASIGVKPGNTVAVLDWAARGTLSRRLCRLRQAAAGRRRDQPSKLRFADQPRGAARAGRSQPGLG